MMSNKSIIKSTATGKTFKTPSGNCNSSNVVYLAECRLCGKQYTGRTVQLLRKRINGHRLWMNKTKTPNGDDNSDFRNEDEAALSDHLKSVHNLVTSDDFDKNLQFTVNMKRIFTGYRILRNRIWGIAGYVPDIDFPDIYRTPDIEEPDTHRIPDMRRD